MTEIQLIDLFDETLRREGVPGHSYLAALLTAALIAAQRDRNGGKSQVFEDDPTDMRGPGDEE